MGLRRLLKTRRRRQHLKQLLQLCGSFGQQWLGLLLVSASEREPVNAAAQRLQGGGLERGSNLDERLSGAFSLCELLDRLKGADQWDWPAVEVHLSALALLRRATPDAPENQYVLDGLRKLAARVDARRDLRKA